MQYIRISYKDFSFLVNPSSLRLHHTKSISTKPLPFGGSRAKQISTNSTIVSGEGAFVGDNARKCIRHLCRLFNEGDSGYLFLPDSTPIKAIFSKLDVKYSGCDDRVEYTFEFVQEGDSKAPIMDFGYTYARLGENLFDIANRTNTDVGDIFRLNKYEDLFSVNEGDKVWLG